jgi:hypothetical protein
MPKHNPIKRPLAGGIALRGNRDVFSDDQKARIGEQTTETFASAAGDRCVDQECWWVAP